jgi:hypothetical protein
MKAWKVQKLFGDVVYDLRSRGLLPVVGLILVAMVAVPMLISRGGTSTTASLQPTAVAAQTAPEAEHAVVSYSPPGLRDYKKRLGGLSAKDPFAQQFSHSAATASALSSTVSVQSTGTGTSPSSSAISGSSNSTGGSSGGGKKKHKKKGSTTAPVVTYQTDLLAGDVDTTLTPFSNVASMTPLPSQNTPVVIYFGLSSDASTALFLVSNKVASVNGPGTCVPSPDDCALLSLKQGQSEDLLYTGDGKIYRIVVAQIKRFTK